MLIKSILHAAGLQGPSSAGRVIDVDGLPAAVNSWPNQGAWPANWDGEKFPTGWGPTMLYGADYWTLRQRSGELFTRSLHAAGLIRRIVTNVVNGGLNLEATPNGRILGIDDDTLTELSEDIESRWELWAADSSICDARGEFTFGTLQRVAYTEAMVSGDVLIALKYHPTAKAPQVQIISGERVQTPYGQKPTQGAKICHGVELDAQGRQVGYWVQQDDGKYKRLPAWGEKSGRRLAWLVYGSDRRLDDVRGMPLLHLVMQSLKDLDRYRDATIRKAVINSMLAMFVKKSQAAMGSMPLTGAALRKDSITAAGVDGEDRVYNISRMMPGVIIETLQQGEEPVPMDNRGVDDKFPMFEEAVISAIAWANEIPPTVLTLGFNSNYSASRAEIIEFDVYKNKERGRFSEALCVPIYSEFFFALVLNRKIAAPGLLEAWGRPDGFEIRGAWISSDWFGMIKPAIDPVKEVNGIKGQLEIGAITHARATRQLTGMKFSRVVPVLARENAKLAESQRPLIEAARQLAQGASSPAVDPDIDTEEKGG